MKKLLVILCCVALCMACGGAQQNKSPEQSAQIEAVETIATSEPVANGVFVCNGKFAKRYHRTRHCSGLGNCQGEIVEMTVEQAEAQGKTPCRKCY